MAFERVGLEPLAYANGFADQTVGSTGPLETFTMWVYQTEDTATAIDVSGYMDDAASQLHVNDVIMAVTAIDTTPVHTMHVVVSNDGTTVDLARFITA